MYPLQNADAAVIYILGQSNAHYSAATQKWLVEHYWQNLMGTPLP